MYPRVFLTSIVLALLSVGGSVFAEDLSNLKQNQPIADFRVANLYTDSKGKVTAAKFWHTPSQAPVYVLQIDTAPQSFMWVDTPATSNRGVAHSLEHLLVRKGTKGRYLSLLRTMRYSQLGAATFQDYNFYCLTSGTGMPGFIEQLHALLDALYEPDFSDVEAEREFYHLGVSTDGATKQKTLVEQGTVYNEMQTGQGLFTYYFEQNKRLFGERNPFSFNIGGIPDEMRDVTPDEIRRFHAKHYRLGPGAGFIFVLPPNEQVSAFLTRLSEEFGRFPNEKAQSPQTGNSQRGPKYAVTPSLNKSVGLYPFPSSNVADPGEIRFGWPPVRTDSQVELRLLQLLLKALADGEQSILYKSLINSATKELDSNATSIEAEVSLQNSPWFPAEFIGLRGVPGNRMSAELIDKIRTHVLAKIATVSAYPDNSAELRAFNQLVMSNAKAWEREQRIWIKSSPLFSSDYKTDWKEYLSYLEMDSAFVRSLSDTSVWKSVEASVSSGKNQWRELIDKFHLLETCYAAASVPSLQLLADMDQKRQRRLKNKLELLEKTYGVGSELEALNRFEQSEIAKTQKIDQIESRVEQPRFTEHPPLTPDDGVKYKQFHLSTVPVIAVMFDDTPTIDLGLSFDLGKIPRKYYKYLSILPRSFDSLGLRSPGESTSYSGLLAETQRLLTSFSIEYSSNSTSSRADLAIRASTSSQEDFQAALTLMNKMLQYSDAGMPNLDRLRDLVDERLAEDDRYGKGDDSSWFWNVSDVFRHQGDPLYVAVNSRFTQARWDGRLKWLLHPPVSRGEIETLRNFAGGILASSERMSSKELAERISQLQVTGLEKELLQYWLRNIALFPENQLIAGLRQLAEEVHLDLSVGPAETLKELKELQRIVVDRNLLKLNITIDPIVLQHVTPALERFLQGLPATVNPVNFTEGKPTQSVNKAPIMQKILERGSATGDEFPWYVGFLDPRSATGGVVFSADFIGYSDLDRQSLIRMLSSKLVSGTGPHSFHMKAVENGLAYSNSLRSDPSTKLIWYYADGVPDIASLVDLLNSFAATVPKARDPFLIDYVLQRSFPFPRSMASFADRGKDLAEDIYDGNDPVKVRRFSEAMLKLRCDPDLSTEVAQANLWAIGPVLLKQGSRDLQGSERSIFFLVGPERLLADAERRLAIPRLLRLYASDFWMD